MSESVVLCEGYHDRAFWKGWLTHLGCTDPGIQPGKTGRVRVKDPFGAPVVGGQFAFLSVGGGFVRVVPCKDPPGKGAILQAARLRLNNRATERLVRLVLCVDSDQNADGSPASTSDLTRSKVESFARTIDPNAISKSSDVIEIDAGATELSLLRWEATDPATPDLPNQQTLERLVCSALRAAFPQRATAVRDWLQTRPDATETEEKEFAWSHMAGWYADRGCEAFYSALWADSKVAHELEQRLRASGAWQIAELLAT